MSETKYFAAANSRNGFIGYFDKIFADIEKLYIIKGGPGTGKSRLMRDVANEAENKNLRVEYYYCSSDPSSLDAILIPELSVGMLDGTAPHTFDPSFPGIREEIIDLGAFWNSEKLTDNKEIILSSIQKKSALFEECYRYIAASASMNDIVRCIASHAADIEKLKAAAMRTAKKFKVGDGYTEKIALKDAISMNGIIEFETYALSAENRCYIRDKYGIGYLYLRELIHSAKQKEIETVISYEAIDPAYENAVYFPSENSVFICCKEITNSSYKIINTDRFILKSELALNRQKLRFAEKCRDAFLDSAVAILSEIKEVHFALESIYSSAMNFKKKEEFTKKLLIKIFKQ